MKHYIEIKGIKHKYDIIPNSDNKTSRVICSSAKIDQNFLNEDIPALLNDLKNLIEAEEKYMKSLSKTIRFRASAKDKEIIQKNVKKYWYKNMSDFLKAVALNPEEIKA